MSSLSTTTSTSRRTERTRSQEQVIVPPVPRDQTAQRRRKLLILAPRIALLGYFTFHVVGTHIPPGWFSVAGPIHLPVSDKLLHFLSYTGLTLAVLAALATVSRVRRVMLAARARWLLPALCLLLAAFGLFDEATQPLVGRNFDWFDWLANVAGISTAAVLVAMGVAVYIRRTQAIQ